MNLQHKILEDNHILMRNMSKKLQFLAWSVFDVLGVGLKQRLPYWVIMLPSLSTPIRRLMSWTRFLGLICLCLIMSLIDVLLKERNRIGELELRLLFSFLQKKKCKITLDVSWTSLHSHRYYQQKCNNFSGWYRVRFGTITLREVYVCVV